MSSVYLDIDVLEDYLDGKLDAKAMHFVERQALEDPFVAEALEGLRHSTKRKASLSILQKQLHDRLAEKPIKRKLWGINTQRLTIAAAATVAFIVVGTLFILRESNRRTNEIAKHKATGVIVNLDSGAVATLPTTDTIKSSNADVIDKAIANAKKGDYAVNKTKLKEITPIPVAVGPIVEEKSVAMADALVENKMVQRAKVSARSFEVKTENKIIGKIVEEGTNKPIPGAIVKIKGTNIGSSADQDGNFNLRLDSAVNKSILEVSYIGFKTQLASYYGGNDIKISLSPENSSLNEVVVTGYAKTSAKKTASVSTMDGALAGKIAGVNQAAKSTENFDAYLAKNNKLLKNSASDNAVSLSFNVDNKGKAQNISLVKPSIESENKEAIRLIKNAPDWIIPANKNDKVYITIKF